LIQVGRAADPTAAAPPTLAAEMIEKKRYECDICKKTYSTKAHLKDHSYVHTGERRFCCDRCEMRFFYTSDLYRHRLKNCVRPYVCMCCLRGFPTEAELKIHAKIHEFQKKKNKTSHKKPKSGSATAAAPATLAAEMSEEKEDRPFQCDVCKKTYKTKGTLTEHSHIHRGQRRLGCDRCGARFFHNQNLKKHRKKNCEDLPHLCTICMKGFAREIELKYHAIGHDLQAKIKKEGHEKVDGVYKCPHCPKIFDSLYDLEPHIRKHTGECPYECGECGMKFPTLFTIQKHQKMHTGDRPFPCTLCPRTYLTVATLNFHLNKVHNQLPYACPHCSNRFASIPDLRNHRLSPCDTTDS
ncbi:hypothetical protein PFISCL1PPCAC_4416, partial [Pristionchus fissidentatus]